MPRLNVIILSSTADRVRCVMWADVPAANRISKPIMNSLWSGATVADRAALQNGSVAEQIVDVPAPPGSAPASIQGLVQAAWQNYQNLVANSDPYAINGHVWDGVIWAVKDLSALSQ